MNLSGSIRHAYIVHCELGLPIRKRQLLAWIAEAEALEAQVAQLRLHCWEGDEEEEITS